VESALRSSLSLTFTVARYYFGEGLLPLQRPSALVIVLSCPGLEHFLRALFGFTHPLPLLFNAPYGAPSSPSDPNPQRWFGLNPPRYLGFLKKRSLRIPLLVPKPVRELVTMNPVVSGGPASQSEAHF